MARIGVMNIAPEVDFACHEYEARDGNLIPNSTYAVLPEVSRCGGGGRTG